MCPHKPSAILPAARCLCDKSVLYIAQAPRTDRRSSRPGPSRQHGPSLTSWPGWDRSASPRRSCSSRRRACPPSPPRGSRRGGPRRWEPPGCSADSCPCRMHVCGRGAGRQRRTGSECVSSLSLWAAPGQSAGPSTGPWPLSRSPTTPGRSGARNRGAIWQPTSHSPGAASPRRAPSKPPPASSSPPPQGPPRQ